MGTKPTFSLPTTTTGPGYKAATKGDLDSAVNAVVDSLWETMKEGRAQVIGSVTAISGGGTTKTVTISQGGFYVEDNSGAVKYVIAPFGPIAIPSGQGLIVDFTTGSVDGSGRYIPELVAIASTLQTGWQTRDRYILVANYNGELNGEYVIATAIEAGLQEQINNAFIGRYQFNTGNPNNLKFDQNAETVSWSDLAINNGALQVSGSIQVAAVTDRVVADGQCLYIDLDDVVDSVTPIPVYEASYLSVYPNTVNGRWVMLIANQYSKWMGELLLLLLHAEQRDRLTTIETSLKASRALVGGTLIKCLEAGGRDFVVSLSEGRAYNDQGGTNAFRYKIAPLTDVTVDAVEVIVSSPTDPLDAEGRRIPQVKNIGDVTVDWQSGDMYVLFANLSNTSSAYSAVKSAYDPYPSMITDKRWSIHDGKACFTVGGGNVTYDDITRTLTWPETIIQIAQSQSQDSSQRIKLEPGSITIPSGDYYVVYLDLTQADYTLTPNTAVSVGQYYLGGWNAADVDKMPLFVATDTFSYPICFPPVYGSTYWPATSEVSPYDMDEILVKQSADVVNIYMKGGRAGSNEYILTPMQHSVNGANGCDVWRINGAYVATRNGDESMTTGMQICNTGEWETAIRQSGKSDFMGGNAHGDEKHFEIHMLIDGVEVPIDGSTTYRCTKVEFLQASNMYEADTAVPQSNIVAKNYKRWVFNQREIELFQHVVWEEAISLDTTYMTMCTVQRWNAAGNLQITDKGFRSPLYSQEDIGATWSVNITAGGTGFTDGEVVEITAADGTGTGMRGTATVSGGAITSIYVNVQNGTGYTSGEAVNIAAIDGSGSGAQGTLARGFSMVDSTSNIAKASGPTGYSFEVEILEGWDKAGRNFNFSNAAQYNKFYFDYTDNYTVSVGETFTARARYKLSSDN